MIEEPTYYSILTATIRYDKRLSSSEKVLYSELTALSSKTGKCWPSNKYFSELYDVSSNCVTKWISHLKELGYIKVEYEYKGKEIVKRIITLTEVEPAKSKSEKNILDLIKNNK